MSPTPVRALLELITNNVSVLEKACASSGTEIPDLYSPFHPSTEAFRTNPDAAEASNVIVAAAHQLAAILTPPQVALYNSVGGAFKSAAIRVCIESNVTEILREAGPQVSTVLSQPLYRIVTVFSKGLHVDDIAKINGQDPRKLGRFLRILSLHHIYREVTPDIFTNTRISSMLDTLKPSKEILADPEHKHINPWASQSRFHPYLLCCA
ncbi:hypothetical protein MPER_06196 [Moniliophthora perniciosa FA553]|nr:hypothetical protein MPER_06196 [Moniliophthora perniciosa FA553]